MKKTYSKPETLLVKTQQALMLSYSEGTEANPDKPVLGRYHNKLWDDDEDDWLLENE
ncbi:MAG: hypothetical protein IJ243_07870 [Prevotella sp.]|nr:hypothetical protein [Prevotella sp.]